MNIFNIIPRTIQTTTTDEGVDFIDNYVNPEGRVISFILCKTYMLLSSSSTSSVLRVLNGTSGTCRTSARMDNSQLEWEISGDLVYKDRGSDRIAFRIEKNEILKLGLDNSTTNEFISEVGDIFKTIAREGRMPSKYRIQPERTLTDDAISAIEEYINKKSVNMVDDIPDDVFTMETIIERIRNCGNIANAKEVPVIIRFDDKKLMITDTSIEDGFLYLDVIKVPKKKIEKPSIKFSDYITYEAPLFNDGDIRHITYNIASDSAFMASQATTTSGIEQ